MCDGMHGPGGYGEEGVRHSDTGHARVAEPQRDSTRGFSDKGAAAGAQGLERAPGHGILLTLDPHLSAVERQHEIGPGDVHRAALAPDRVGAFDVKGLPRQHDRAGHHLGLQVRHLARVICERWGRGRAASVVAAVSSRHVSGRLKRRGGRGAQRVQGGERGRGRAPGAAPTMRGGRHSVD